MQERSAGARINADVFKTVLECGLREGLDINFLIQHGATAKPKPRACSLTHGYRSDLCGFTSTVEVAVNAISRVPQEASLEGGYPVRPSDSASSGATVPLQEFPASLRFQRLLEAIPGSSAGSVAAMTTPHGHEHRPSAVVVGSQSRWARADAARGENADTHGDNEDVDESGRESDEEDEAGADDEDDADSYRRGQGQPLPDGTLIVSRLRVEGRKCAGPGDRMTGMMPSRRLAQAVGIALQLRPLVLA